ncbi:MAG: helix-turn-helix transcriptional regulator [Caldilineaceae bacterium]|nr:helix-turn-helix transcriptional regulator [Caldilineaceae bacterium]
MNGNSVGPLAEFVRERLAKLKWSQAEAARAAGISQGALSNLLNQKAIPETATVEKLADALSVSRTHMFALLAGLSAHPQSELDPTAAYIARRLTELPSKLREQAIDAVAGVVDAFSALEHGDKYDALMQRAEIEADHEAGINLLMSSPEAMEEVLEEYYLLKMEQGDPEAEQMLRAVRNRRASSNAAQQQR